MTEKYAYSLDWTDDQKHAHDNDLPPLKMHDIIANDPVAAAKCYRTFVKLLLKHVFNSSSTSKTLHPDGVAGHEGLRKAALWQEDARR